MSRPGISPEVALHTVYSVHHRLHATDTVQVPGYPFDTWEVPARAEAILEAVQAADLGPVVPPTDHGLEPILAVHDADYVAFLRTVYSASAAESGQAAPVFTETFATRYTGRKPQSWRALKGYYAFGWGSPILEGTWQAAYWAAQCALTAADLVREGHRTAYALCRPPGHHSAADLYGGYCYLNNAAIAARALQAGDERVAVLDVDYHHGNGTQAIFYAEPSVLYASLHADPAEAYPYFWGEADERGEGPGLDCNRNWPLPPGTGDERFLDALDQALSAIRGCAPRWLVVSAGFDTVEGDPEGEFTLSTAGLHEIGGRIAGLELPTVLVQEGGYRLERLGQDAVAFLSAFAP
jgi:acetoin utilization deacetylase AcuC-like enzyme